MKSLFLIFSLFSLIAPAITAAGLYVPLYMYPGADWTTLINLKKTYPSLPIIAIINPGSGPGTSADSVYTDYINRLEAVGILVYGYVYTTRGTRAAADVKTDIDTYQSFYPKINGIFFDEFADTTGKESYYTDLSAYAASKGFTLTNGNPGQNIPASYANTVNIFLVSETTGTIDLSVASSWLTQDKSKIALIVHTESSLPKKWVVEACKVSDWIYVTDDIMPNPYDVLPSYIADLAALLDGTCNGNEKKSKVGMILGIVFGVLGGLAVVIAIFYGVRRYKIRKNLKSVPPMIVEEKV